MISILIIIFIFFVVGVILFNVKEIKKYKKHIFYFTSLVLFCIAAFRGEGVDRDYLNYKDLFLDNNNAITIIEPSFLLIDAFVKLLSCNFVCLIFIYAFLGVSLKIIAIKQLSEFWFISLFLYFCYSFTLHEMTQIRVGVAIGFVLISLKSLSERKIFYFLIFASLATFFHYSSLFVFLLLFINTKKINKWVWMSLIPISYLMFFLGFSIYNVFEFLPFDFLQNKLLNYAHELDNGHLNVFNAWQMIRILYCVMLLLKIDIIVKRNEYSILVIKLFVLSIIILPLLSNNYILAVRISDILAISEIIAVPYIFYIFPSNHIARLIIIIMYGFSFFFLNIFYNGGIFN